MSTPLTVALAGNPNVGKSTIFNALTGSHQHVGNWPGKTIEKKEGTTYIADHAITVVDLPGTYSLNAYSLEEIITRDYLVHETPNAVIAVVDASNLARNLYLVTQLMEMSLPLILVLNMADTARNRGLEIDTSVLSNWLGGAPVVEAIGSQRVGIDAIKAAIASLDKQAAPTRNGHIVDYGAALEPEIAALADNIADIPALAETYRPRWLAIKLLENDEDLAERLTTAGHSALVANVRAAADRIAQATEDDAETLITDRRYLFIAEAVHNAVTRTQGITETVSDRVDRVVTHPIWGMPVFLLMMWLIFQFTANVSAPFLDWIDAVISGPLTHWAQALLDAVHLGDSWLAGLVIDGAIAGVGGVLVFVPVLVFLYVAVALLEDTGYMARSAFVMDRLMRLVGLPGKSFLPLMVGFGCTVPAIYATRTLDNASDRKLTAFLTPFMSCGARLPVYVVFGTAFFGADSGNLLFGMYLLGIGIALGTGFLLRHTLYRNEPPQPFVLEMPPYRLPTPVNVWRQVWDRTSDFLRNATTIILLSSIIIWLLLAVPTTNEGDFNDVRAEDSLFGAVSDTLSPIFAPAGFGNWESAGSLITGFVAKEAVISTMNQVYVEEAGEAPEDTTGESADTPTFGEDVEEIATGFGEALILTAQETVNILPRTVNLVPGINAPEGDWLDQSDDEETTTELEGALTAAFAATAGSAARGDLAAVAFNVFVLLYVPCMATVAAMRHEFGLGWMTFQVVYTLGVSWLAAVIVYQGGLLLGVV